MGNALCGESQLGDDLDAVAEVGKIAQEKAAAQQAASADETAKAAAEAQQAKAAEAVKQDTTAKAQADKEKVEKEAAERKKNEEEAAVAKKKADEEAAVAAAAAAKAEEERLAKEKKELEDAKAIAEPWLKKNKFEHVNQIKSKVTPLYNVCYDKGGDAKNLELVKALLKCGADPKLEYQPGKRPVDVAKKHYEKKKTHVQIIALLS